MFLKKLSCMMQIWNNLIEASTRFVLFAVLSFVVASVTLSAQPSGIGATPADPVRDAKTQPTHPDQKTHAVSAQVINPSMDDVAFLTQLGLIRGHLTVGLELFKLGLPEQAESHMKHPEAELYATLVPTFEARGCPGFTNELSALALAIEERHSLMSVMSVFESLDRAIERCERVANHLEPNEILAVIENLMQHARFEYNLGIVNGQMQNLHEYQDAWGFTQVAASYVDSSKFKVAVQSEELVTHLNSLFEKLRPLWPSLDPHESELQDLPDNEALWQSFESLKL